MFKPKKQVNENAIKKDFFSKKKNTSEEILKIEQDVDIDSLFNIDKIKDIISIPKKGKQSFILTNKRSNPFEILDKIKVDEILVFCSRINKKQFEEIKNLNIIGIGLSNRVLEKDPELHQSIKNKTVLKFENNHSKMTLIKSNENYIVIEGSGNPSINARNEFYIIHNSKQMYNLIKKSFEDA